MRKKILILMTILLSVACTIGFTGVKKVLANTSVETDVFLPSGYVEYYELSCPQSVYSSGDKMLITEFNPLDSGSANDLLYYDGSEYKVFNGEVKNATYAKIYEHYLILLMRSRLFYIDLNSTEKQVEDMNVTVATSFDISGNNLVGNDSSYVNLYTLADEGTKPVATFVKRLDIPNTTVTAYTESGNIIYYVNQSLECYEGATSSSFTINKNIESINYMVEKGGYIYYTSATGVYKIACSQNAQSILLIGVTEGANDLGYLSAPSGIAFKNGNVLVGDSKLNAVQEIDVSTGKFTSFAITTEATADYRLTKSAEKLIKSENYLYAIDKVSLINSDIKRIVKISVSGDRTYKKIDLTDFYEDYLDFKIENYACSDDKVFLSFSYSVLEGIDKKQAFTSALYEQVDEGAFITLKEYELNGNKVKFEKPTTAVNYLDGIFSYTQTFTDILGSAIEYVSVQKILLPTTENELTETQIVKITGDNDIKGKAKFLSADIFGNTYVVHNDDGRYYLAKYYNKKIRNSLELDFTPKSLEVDFNGNAYILTDDSKIKKIAFNGGVASVKEFAVKNDLGFEINSICLDYTATTCYMLGGACIFKNADNTLDIESLSKICADGVNKDEIISDLKFIKLSEDAKLFKVSIDSFVDVGGSNYFDSVTPISSPNLKKVYLVISEVGTDYYLISYSDKFVALVKKSAIEADESLIESANYDSYSITDKVLVEDKLVTNFVNVYSKPILDKNYLISSLNREDELKTVKYVTYNSKNYTLVEKDVVVIGYVQSGYLQDELTYDITSSTEKIAVIDNDGKTRVKYALVILILTFAITITMILVENKLLSKRN